MFNNLEILDSIRLNFSPTGLFIMNLTIAFIMFGIALDLNYKQFQEIIAKPKSLITGMISQFVLLPAVTFLLVKIINPSPAVALGMILVAACPGGMVSNFISSLAKGNVALSVSMTAFATIAAIILTPANFALWGSLYIKSSPLLRPLEIDPLQMFITVIILMGIPISLGILFNRYFPGMAKKIIKPIRIFSFLAFIAFIIMAFASNFDHFLNYIPPIFVIVLIHNALGLFTGWSFAKIMKRPVKDIRAISLETGIQNSALGLILIFNPKIFPPDLDLGGMAFIAAWWGIWHIISGLILAGFWSQRPVTQVT
ncbi:MAG: bile acid:sodium symporter family protein [Bacteroidia bacterium]|nr:bile acid:sodium symporter family protein [Bacteroidia bacterium]